MIRIILMSAAISIAAYATAAAGDMATREADRQFKAAVGFLERGMGEYAVNQQMVDRAREAFKGAIELDPGNARARHQLGVASLAMDDPAAASRQYEALRELDADMAASLKGLIDAYVSPVKFEKVGETLKGSATRQGGVIELEPPQTGDVAP